MQVFHRISRQRRASYVCCEVTPPGHRARRGAEQREGTVAGGWRLGGERTLLLSEYPCLLLHGERAVVAKFLRMKDGRQNFELSHSPWTGLMWTRRFHNRAETLCQAEGESSCEGMIQCRGPENG